MRKPFKRPDMAERNKQRMKNYDGMRFHNFVVIKRDHQDDKGLYWFLCKCDCGKRFLVRGGDLKNTKSCGCMTREYMSRSAKTHGESKTGLYSIWHHMIERCYKPYNKSYADYGGRGITVCPEWRNDYVAFRDWALRNGYDNDARFMECTLDRIDVNGNYEPSNCRWVSMKEQCNNRRNNKFLTYNGETHTMSEWAEIIGIHVDTLWRRQKRGWDDEKIITTPLRMKKDVEKKVMQNE